jgi:hypothetical protein
VLLPVVPSAGLKESVLAASIGSGGAAAGGGGLMAAIAGGGVLMKSSAVAVTVAAGVAVTGAAVQVASDGSDRGAAPAAVNDQRAREVSAPAAGGPGHPSNASLTAPTPIGTGGAAIGTGLATAPGQNAPAADGPGRNGRGRALGHDKPNRGADKPDKPATPSHRGESPPGGGYGRGGTDVRGRSEERGGGNGNAGRNGNGRALGRDRATGNGNGNGSANGNGSQNGAGNGRGETQRLTRGNSDSAPGRSGEKPGASGSAPNKGEPPAQARANGRDRAATD